MATNGKTKLIAIVDDDDLMRSALQGMMKAVGWTAQAFASAEEFLKSGQQTQTACLIADIRMPGMSGLELQAKLNAEHCRIPTIFITAHGDAKMRMQALRAGAVRVFAQLSKAKPRQQTHASGSEVICGKLRKTRFRR
jgi:FixJ family two-component response regulator